MAEIRIILVDDQKLFIQSLKTVLEGNSKEIKVIGIAYSGKEAIELVKLHNPDVVLMDVRMPGMDGVEATRIIHESYPDIKIMILTTFDDDEYVHQALYHGAVGYVLKNILPEQLITSIKVVNDGSLLVSPTVGNKLVRDVYSSDEKRKERNAEINRLLSLFNTLSKREGEVLDLMLQDYSNSDIADQLYIAEQTVKNHISTIYSKLCTVDRFQTIKKVKSLLEDSSEE